MSAADTAELVAELERALRRHLARPIRITALERRPSPYGSSFALEELEVRLDDGVRVPLVFKDVSRGALLEDARRVKPEWFHDPLREIEIYQIVLDGLGLGTATCYGSVVEPAQDRYWLFLERVAGVELYQVGELAYWKTAAAWLGRFHARLGADAPELARVPLLDYNADLYRRWMRRAVAFAPEGSRGAVEWLRARHERAVDRLVALPATFIHGEFYPANVLLEMSQGTVRVCPIDWEMAALGPGLIDLAALTDGGWSEAEQASLALAYRTALASAGSKAPEDFDATLDCCRLHLAVQWLGWAAEWSPPATHAQDWLGGALRLAERLRL